MNILVGYNGFVGSNILRQMNFDYLYNSKNINDAFNTKPDLCIYAGVKSMKFYANKNPIEDYNHILETIENIKKINPKRLILISTIDVFDILEKVDEKHQIKDENLQPYGKNRRILEKWVEENIESYNIVRLPALYGNGLKKNFLFDLMNPIPNTLSKKSFEKLSEKNDLIDIIEFYKGLGDIIEPKKNEFMVV